MKSTTDDRDCGDSWGALDEEDVEALEDGDDCGSPDDINDGDGYAHTGLPKGSGDGISGPLQWEEFSDGDGVSGGLHCDLTDYFDAGGDGP